MWSSIKCLDIEKFYFQKILKKNLHTKLLKSNRDGYLNMGAINFLEIYLLFKYKTTWKN